MMKPRWRFLNTGADDGPHNMAIDEAILRTVRGNHGPTTVRVYGWKPRAISVGYGQNVHRDIDVERCRQSQTPIVRRLTGGRAVLHDEETTYSVVASVNDPTIGQSAHETYRRIGRALVCGLKNLGVDAELHRISTGRGRNPSCFSSTGRYEIVVGDKKMIGSAQRRFEGVLLQHGSLLTGPGYRDLNRFLLVKNCSSLADDSMDLVITLSEILGHTPSLATIAEALHGGFEKALGCQLIEGDLSDNERAQAEQLCNQRYESDEWNLRRETSQTNRELQKHHSDEPI